MICLKHLLIPIPRIIAEECALKKLSASLNLLKMTVLMLILDCKKTLKWVDESFS